MDDPGEDKVGLLAKLLESFAKSGPWAVLAFAILGFIAYQAHEFVALAGGAVAEYVVKSGEAIDQMGKSIAELAAAKAATLEAITATQDGVTQNGKNIEQSLQSIERMTQMMEQAYKMMEDAPQQREEQIKLLNQIIAELQTIRVQSSIGPDTP